MQRRPLSVSALAVGLGVAGALPAQALDLWDGRIQLHGFYESRLSFGMEDFNPGKGVDMYGWLHVVDLEADVGIAPDGWGPFDLVSAFARVEVKYDCVWSHACGIFPSVDSFGNHPGNLPERAQNARRPGTVASQETFDRRPYWFDDRTRLTPGLYYDAQAGQRQAVPIPFSYTAVGLFGASPGPDGQLGEIWDIRDGDPTSGLPGDDDAGLYLFDNTYSCRTGAWARKDSSRAGWQTRELPWSIEGCHIDAIGSGRSVANPFSDSTSSFGGDSNPVLIAVESQLGDLPTVVGEGIPLATQLPFRPGAENPAGAALTGPKWESQGIFLPSATLRQELKRNSFENPQQNFTLDELRWNRGASQETWKELRELYVDLELFDSRLWLRAGKQTIVWGKTEIFRNQDQWNPVDIAIGPLASLEESRIALWALRGVWSFYEVGPLEDVRLELVGLFDKFEPTDVGRCGEPWVPRIACDKTFGLWVHGQNANGIAGEIRPDDPWDDSSGIEAGARVEFRWERFSFAVSDYWGYNDSAYQSILFQYSRNVDPLSGRPRHTQATGRCATGDPLAEPDCLAPNHPLGDIVEIHSINQSMFAWVCAGTVGVAPTVDPTACAFTLFNSQNLVDPVSLPIPFATFFSSIVGGSVAGQSFLNLLLGESVAAGGSPKIGNELLPRFGPGSAVDSLFYISPPNVSPLVPLVYDGPTDNASIAPATRSFFSTYTTAQQAALFGCDAFYGIDCDARSAALGGFDLANAEAGVLLQAFPWFEGTYFDPHWDTTDPTLPQPGTVDALIQGYGADIPPALAASRGIRVGDIATGAVGTRYENGELSMLPGSRYDAVVVEALAADAGISLSPGLQGLLDQYGRMADGTFAADGREVDGSVRCGAPDIADASRCRPVPGTAFSARVHPFTGQFWASEMAIASWNLMMLAAGLGAEDSDPDGVPDSGDERVVSRATLDRSQPFALGRCSYAQPQFCNFISGFMSQARLTSAKTLAGGNGHFGRRNFVWQTVGEIALRYQKRNIFGFGMDFAEDTTKSSWGVEFTHVNDSLTADNSEYDGLSAVDEFNLTISVDRPTFINFLNANRTFLLNGQLFTSYISGYHDGMTREGPWTFLGLLNIQTAYFQDRFLVSSVLVWEVGSSSGAFLPSVQYRMTENLSLTVGANVFTGGFSKRDMGINQFSAFDEDNLESKVYVENGVSPVRDLDSFFARIRYTF